MNSLLEIPHTTSLSTRAGVARCNQDINHVETKPNKGGRTKNVQGVKKSLCLSILALLLVGCETTPPPRDVAAIPEQELFERCTVERDDFRKVTHVLGPIFSIGSLNGTSKCRLIGTKSDRGSPRFYLRIDTYLSDWAFWKHIYDSNGNRIEIETVDRDVGHYGTVREVLDTEDLKRSYFTSHQVDWKLYGNRGSCTFKITPNMTSAFFKKCDEVFSQ